MNFDLEPTEIVEIQSLLKSFGEVFKEQGALVKYEQFKNLHQKIAKQIVGQLGESK